MIQPLPCIICGVQPEPVFRSEEGTDQPYGATQFFSEGHYGSTVWDPMSSHKKLQLNICDSCLKLRHDQIVVVEEIVTPREWVSRPWRLDEPQ